MPLDPAELALGSQQARHAPPPPHIAVTPPRHPRRDLGMVAVELPEAPFFRAVMAQVRDEGPRGFAIESDAWELLKLRHSSPIAVLKID